MADRAKQSSLQQKDGIPSRPEKQAKSSSSTPSTPIATTTNNTESDFYLKHQNRALATELQSVQAAKRELEQERDARREHCRAAFVAVAELNAVWNIANSTANSTPDVPSTGTGDAVEWTGAIQRALAALGTTTPLGDATVVLDTLKERAQAVRSQVDDGDDGREKLQAQCVALQEQALEMAASRTHVVARERRVRRNLYRMAAGIMTPDQVVKALERDGEDSEIEAQVKLEQQAMEAASAAASTSASSDQPMSADAVAEMDELKERIRCLESSILRSEDAISQLNTEISQKEERITQLSQRQLTDDDTKRLEELESTKLQLQTVEKTAVDLRSRIERREERWALALGNEKAIVESSNELIGKFNKRWAELTGVSLPSTPMEKGNDGAEKSDSISEIVATLPQGSPEILLTQQVAELQHKLEQSLDHVRQAETVRENLRIALDMNGTLQAKLDEVKTKYALLQKAANPAALSAAHLSSTGKSSSNGKSAESKKPPTAAKESNGSDAKPQQSAESQAKYKKLSDSYKRAKQEVTHLTARKDELKAKVERTEKERDGLMESNRRLLKQVGEKDEMNATSLSTILQLKSQTDKLSAERDQLEEQSKTASQLALAARLATNAKEKVSEELILEKEKLESRVQSLEKETSLLRAELEQISKQCSEASGKMAVKELELKNANNRSQELVTETERKKDEIRRLMDVVSKAESEARSAKEKLAQAQSSGICVQEENGKNGASSSFTVDQLQTQIRFLKNRLACPVCHYRDKECIILRCRHMHCKQCVDERISNRSRKCPTCNVKFSENDVGDIWLN